MTTQTTITERPADMHTADALAYARQTHADAVRASYVTMAHPGRAKAMIGQRVMLDGVEAVILRCGISDTSNGYRVSLIVSVSAAAR